MPSQRKRRIGTCAYCGQVRPITRDHVVPRCLFTRPLPKHMVTVPACDQCNHRKGQHDSFLRDLLTSDIAGNESPIARRIFEEKVLSSHRQNKSLLARIVLREAELKPVLSDSGMYLDECYVAHFDLRRAIEMFSFLVRGLYYRTSKVVLPAQCEFTLRRLTPDAVREIMDFFVNHNCNGPYSVGTGVFWCAYLRADTDDTTTVWLLVFYDRIVYAVTTGPPDKQPSQTR